MNSSVFQATPAIGGLLSHQPDPVDDALQDSPSRCRRTKAGARRLSDFTIIMSQVPLVTVSPSERDGSDALVHTGPASSAPTTVSTTSNSNSNPKPKVRSCVTCRTRKVRCDKESPCSNCRRANIPCVLPSTDRPPRWARRLGRNGINASGTVSASNVPPEAMERIRHLESLVKDLSGQLERANAGSSSGVGSPASSSHDQVTDSRREDSPTTNTGNVQKAFGRLVLQDSNRSRYVSSGFWSRVNDEVCSSLISLSSSCFMSIDTGRWVDLILIPQRKTLLAVPQHRPRNLNERLQSGIHFCLATI
jgi:hypothetical protein